MQIPTSTLNRLVICPMLAIEVSAFVCRFPDLADVVFRHKRFSLMVLFP
jgi:hypothetical protein